MKTSELRIGNYVSVHKGFEMMVTSIFTDEVYLDFIPPVVNEGDVWISNIKDVQPIELTEDHLLKLGFKMSKGKWGNDFHILEKDGFICMFTIEHWTDTKEDSKFKNHWHCKYQLNGNKLKYVHQLQNLYFALTGEELTYK